MFKKIVAANAALVFVLAFFACSSEDGDNNENKPGSSSAGDIDATNSSSSEVEEPSSSSRQLIEKEIINNNAVSATFGTYTYCYALKGGETEDLTQFWDVNDLDKCPIVEQTTAPDSTCALDQTNAILQNKLTNQYADLHYIVNVITTHPTYVNKLDNYNLSEEGDQAAIGLDVGTGPKGISTIEGTIAFIYRYTGGAHQFRAVTETDNDFWFVNVPAQADTANITKATSDVTISISDFKGMGSLAENEEAETEAVPFDLSKVKKFLWAVEYDPEVEANNTGTLAVNKFRALIE